MKANATSDKAAYIRNRAFDKQHYSDLVLSYLAEFGEATRPELDKLLLDKLSDALNLRQKRRAVANLLQEMRKAGLVVPDGTTRWVKWRMTNPAGEDSGSR